METLEITLTPAEVRKLLTVQYGEPVFRLVIPEAEARAIHESDWTLHQLRDGRFAIWRAKSARNSAPEAVRRYMDQHLISDHVE